MAHPVGHADLNFGMATKGRSTVADESGEECVPIDKPEDLPEVHQRRYAEIVDELKAKVLAMYVESLRRFSMESTS